MLLGQFLSAEKNLKVGDLHLTQNVPENAANDRLDPAVFCVGAFYRRAGHPTDGPERPEHL